MAKPVALDDHDASVNPFAGHSNPRGVVAPSDELTPDDWIAARKVLVEGNESFTDDDILRRLAARGIKLVKLREDDHAYVAGLLRADESFG